MTKTLTVYVEKEDIHTLLKHGEVNMGPTYLVGGKGGIDIVIALNSSKQTEVSK